MVPLLSTVFTAPVVVGTGVAIGDLLIPSSASGDYVLANATNRAGRRCEGVAVSALGPTQRGAVQIQSAGTIDKSISGIGAGLASWVRCSEIGRIERCTPLAGDDVIGYCETDGRVHLSFGFGAPLEVPASATANSIFIYDGAGAQVIAPPIGVGKKYLYHDPAATPRFGWDVPAGGGGGGGGFDISTLPLSGWWDGPGYNSGTLLVAGKSSAGASAGRNLAVVGAPVASTENGLASVLFDGVDDKFQYISGAESADLMTASSWSFSFVGRLIASPNNTLDPFQNACLAVCGSANFAISYRTDLVLRAYQYRAGNVLADSTWASSQLVCVQAYGDGSSVNIRKGKGAWVTTATGGAPLVISGSLRVGSNYQGIGAFGQLEFCEMFTSNSVLSTTQFNSAADAHATRWGVIV
jgi:hypothetical protein